MFVVDIKENCSNYGLPREFADCLPAFCETCKAPLEISESLTGLHCSNPRCKDKMVMRVKAVCQDLGVLSFGESTIEKFVETYSPDSPLDIFFLEEGMDVGEGVSPKVSKAIIEQISKKNTMLLWEYVMIANIPFVRTSAQKIFGGYTSLEKAYEDIEKGGVEFIKEKLGVSGGEDGISIQALKIYKNLLEYKEDLFSGYERVHIIDLGGVKELNVVCSDQVGAGFAKKNEFYAYINSSFGDKVHVNFLPAVNKKIDYLVWAGADGSPARYTNKVKTAEGYNAKGSNIPIVTAGQFIDIIKAL